MKARSILLVIALLVAISPLAFSQSRETGSIEGTVVDQEKAPLPGVTVTATSPNLMGVRTTITDAQGAFRFPALPPGTYQIKAELKGFKTTIQSDIHVQTTMRLSLDITMQQSAIEEQITVQAQSPTVDVKSTETASVTLTNEILRNIPYDQFSSDIVNLAPGVTENVAYGASQDTGIAYTMDGVNVADPEAGSAWVFVDHNIIEEAKVMGVGLPAEYGNFTGVIFNLVTKSGGNTFSGHFEADYQGKKGNFPKSLWQTDNNQHYVSDFPDLTSPLLSLYDISGHVGGPIVKDKVWFYTGVQYYRSFRYPTGFPEAVDYKQPRWFGKLSAQLSPSTPMTFSLEVDTYLGKNRGASATVLPEATVNQTSPEVVGNFSLTHIFTPTTFLDVKAAYFWGYYYLEPVHGRDISGHYDITANQSNTNSSNFYDADRTRFQANVALTHYAENFIQGSHDFKFGVEVERSWARTRYGFTGLNHTYYVDYTGYAGYPGGPYRGPVGPAGQYLAYQYKGYDINTSYIRLEAFAQDSWQISNRLNVNLGLRLSNNWGFVKGVNGSVFHTMRLVPRVGFTFDLLGDKTTIFKAHYGQYTEAMLTAMIDRLNPSSAFSSYVKESWNGTAFEPFETIPSPTYQLQDDIKHPYMEQWTASIERELFKDASLTVTYINRAWKSQIFRFDRATTWAPVDVTLPADTPGGLGGQTVTYYNLTSDPAVQDRFLQNWDTSTLFDAALYPTPVRKYWGWEFLFNKRFSNRWQLIASYVYSKAYGNIDNSFGGDIGWQASNGIDNPNLWVNAYGNLTFDPTHMVKVDVTYLLPFGIYASAYFHGITGDTWTARYRTGSSLLNQGRQTNFVQARGSNHYPFEATLDMRLEKTFTLAEKYRLGVIVDVFNLFNNNTIEDWGTLLGNSADWFEPSHFVTTNGHDLYIIQNPRQARVGLRLIF